VQEEQGQIKPGCRAVEIELGSRRLFARVQADGSPRLREAVLQALEALEYVQVVGPTDYADRLFAVQDKGPDCAGYLVTSDGEAGPTQAALDGEALVRQLQPALERAYALIKLAEMENPRPAFEVELWADRPVGQGYRIGEIATLHFRTSRDCHVTLLDVGTDGSVTVLFPNRFHVNNRVRAGQTYDIPSPAMGFRIRVHGPPGTEVVKAIATEQPLDLTHLSLKAVEAAFPRIEPVDEYAEELPEMIAAEQEAEGVGQAVPLASWASAAWVAEVRE
jgi:hypothetical protein